MRCLHCNKKLSLLKLAKGDSFCSPEHFDAYQLQQSKDAFQRLINLTDEDAPKAPLVVKPKEETVAPPEENLAMARLNALGPPLSAPLPAAPPAPAARTAVMNAPPYAPFATSALPAYPPQPPSTILNGPEANVPVDAARELAFPVHEVESTAGILNLYLQLSLAGAGPRNWESERSFPSAPEDCRLAIHLPGLAFTTEFPEIESLAPVEADAEDQAIEVSPIDEPVDLAPAVEALPIEAVADAETAPELVPELAAEPVELAPALEVLPVEAEPEAETAPALMPVTAAEPVDLVPSVEALSAEALPFAESAPPIVPVMPDEPAELAPAVEELPAAAVSFADEPLELAPAVEAVPPVAALPRSEAPAATEAVPFNGPVMQTEPVSLESLPPLEFSEARVPYLVAPSFLERAGASTFVDGEASSVPTASTLDCVLNGGAASLDSSLQIPMSTWFAATTELPSRDSAGHSVNGASELPILPPFIVPDARKQICENAWTLSDHRFEMEQTVVEASWASTRALDFDQPAPASLLVRPGAQGFGAADPEKLPGVSPLDAASVMTGILETQALGSKPPFIDPPSSAVEPGWDARLAPFPDPKPFPGAWQYRTSHCPVASELARWSMAPMVPQESVSYEPECTKVDGIKMAPLPAPYSVNDQYRVARWAEAESALAGIAGEAGLVFNGLPTLPRGSAIPAGSFKTQSRGAVLSWGPSAMVSKEAPPAKFLPVRDGAILPAVKSWPLLESLPL